MFQIRDGSVRQRWQHVKGTNSIARIHYPRSVGLPASVHVCLIATFDDAEALKRYQAHPVHQAVTERIGPLRKARHLLDYAVSDEAHTVDAAELSLVV